MFLVNYSCFLKCIENYLVNYSYFGSCPKFEGFCFPTKKCDISQVLQLGVSKFHWNCVSFICMVIPSLVIIIARQTTRFLCDMIHSHILKGKSSDI